MENKQINVLLVEAAADDASVIKHYLTQSRGGADVFSVKDVSRLSTACHLLEHETLDEIWLSLILLDKSGLEALNKIREKKPKVPIIVFAGFHDDPTAIQAVKMGAQAYLIKGTFDGSHLGRVIQHAIEQKKLII